MTEGAKPAQDIHSFELPVQSLRWECPESWLGFEDTRELPHLTGIEGQNQSGPPTNDVPGLASADVPSGFFALLVVAAFAPVLFVGT